jgi:1-acyl-sn-glycerol-3-phosphate acyltransferase
VPQEYPDKRVEIFKRADGILRETGDSVYLSPEGMRVTTGEIGHFNKGSFHLATSLHAQIVPIYFAIPREINPGTGYDAKPGLIDVYFLPPIDTSRWVLADLEGNRDAVRDLFVRVHDSMRSTGRLPESLTIESATPLSAEALV